MAVYVDMLINYGWKLGPSCHMTADNDTELHAFALKIGLKKAWHQPNKHSALSHYDLVQSKRKLAVAKGAIEIDRNEVSKRISEALKLKNGD